MNGDTDLEDAAPWVVLIITLIGAGLRVLLLATKGMSTDETVNLWLASLRPGEITQWIHNIGQQPPLYYFLLHFWIALKGNSPYDVRLLSVLFGTATIPIIYLIGKRIGDALVGVVAAVILAVSPYQLFFAQETSMYTLLTFNAAVAILALTRLLTDPRSVTPFGQQFRVYLRALRSPAPVEPNSKDNFSYQDKSPNQNRWGGWRTRNPRLSVQMIETDLTWVAFIVFSVATLISHNTAPLFFITTNLFVLALMLIQKSRRSTDQPALQAPTFKNWGGAQIAILVLWVPSIIPYLRQPNSVLQSLSTPAPSWAAIQETLSSFFSISVSIPPVATGMWILYALLFCFGLWFFRKKLSQFLLLLTLFTAPFLIEIIVSIWHPFFLGQTLIWTTIPLLLLLAAGIAQLKFRVLIFTVLGVVSLLNVFSASDYFRFYYKEDWNSAARIVEGRTEKGDLVLFNSNIAEIPFDYYYNPYRDLYSLEIEEQGVPLDLFTSGVSEPRMTSSDVPGLVSLLNGHDRVWLVYSQNATTDPLGLISQTLASRMKLIKQESFYGGEVQLYVTP